MTEHLAIFERERPRLQALAYRLTGRVTEAEDLLQDVFLRWQQVSLDSLRQPVHYLSRMVTHAALDLLRSARHQREVYTGPWLPEPWLNEDLGPEQALELSDTLSTAFLLLLERLSPLERAVFLLRGVFDYGYDEIAVMLGESPAHCRQLLHRAREQIQGQRRRPVAPERQQALLTAFLQACQQGEFAPLQALLSEDAVLYSDGGGKVRAALRPIYGGDKVARFLAGLLNKGPSGMVSRPAWINGNLGLLVSWDGQLRMSMSFEWQEDGIAALFLVLNPDKLAHLPS